MIICTPDSPWKNQDKRIFQGMNATSAFIQIIKRVLGQILKPPEVYSKARYREPNMGKQARGPLQQGRLNEVVLKFTAEGAQHTEYEIPFGKLRALLDTKVADPGIQPSLLSLSHQTSCTMIVTSTCSNFLFSARHSNTGGYLKQILLLVSFIKEQLGHHKIAQLLYCILSIAIIH